MECHRHQPPRRKAPGRCPEGAEGCFSDFGLFLKVRCVDPRSLSPWMYLPRNCARKLVALLESNDAKRVFTHTNDLDHPSLVFMFPGGGAQYVRMGMGLYEKEPVFREWV